MNSLEKTVVIVLMLGIAFLGLTLSGGSYLKNKNPEPVSQQDRRSVAAIEREENSGNLTSTEAAIEKDSATRAHSIKF